LDAVEAVVRAGVADGETGVGELTRRVDLQLGPFPELFTEIAAGVRSHLTELS
jgi:hypothetical protein